MKIEVFSELEGWNLLFAELSIDKQADTEHRTIMLKKAEEKVKKEFHSTSDIGKNATILSLRTLFKKAGTDPSRYRVASEALLRRVVKGKKIPLINQIVDFNNYLSLITLLPCCVIDTKLSSPLVWRSGNEGEWYISLKGTKFNLKGKPTLFLKGVPVDTPITGNDKFKVTSSTQKATLVIYLPRESYTTSNLRTIVEESANDFFIKCHYLDSTITTLRKTTNDTF